jgi:serine/threonine protein kinase
MLAVLVRSVIERFEPEAEPAAAINHPNICTVYEIGEFDGSPYMAMELMGRRDAEAQDN